LYLEPDFILLIALVFCIRFKIYARVKIIRAVSVQVWGKSSTRVVPRNPSLYGADFFIQKLCSI